MSEVISLFHGTTLAAVERIRVEGWQVQELSGIVGDLAVCHDVPVADVMDDLRRYNRFMVIEHGRGQVVSLTPNYEAAAGSWAQRAPEALWEALWAIWRTKHSGETELYDWNMDVSGHAWVLQQMAHQKLAVVEVALTVDELLDLGAQVGGFSRGPLTLEIVPILNAMPEICLPLPFQPSAEVIIHEVERRVGWDVFAHWLGLTNEEFIAHDKAGRFGSPGEGVFDSSPWWPLSAVNVVLESVDAERPLDQL